MKKLVTIIALLLLISGCTKVIVPPEDFSEENQQLAEIYLMKKALSGYIMDLQNMDIL